MDETLSWAVKYGVVESINKNLNERIACLERELKDDAHFTEIPICGEYNLRISLRLSQSIPGEVTSSSIFMIPEKARMLIHQIMCLMEEYSNQKRGEMKMVDAIKVCPDCQQHVMTVDSVRCLECDYNSRDKENKS